MRTLSAPLQAALYNYQTSHYAECWDFYLSAGADLRHWTSYTANVTWGGTTWLAGVVGISKGKGYSESGTNVASLDVELAGTVSVGGVPLQQAALALSFSGARVVYSRVYFDAPGGSTIGRVVLFDGVVYPQDPATFTLQLTLKSALAKADGIQGFREVMGPCPFVVYGTECGATVQETSATVAASSTVWRVNLSSVPATALPGSRLTFTSGALNGITARIRSTGAGYVMLDRALGSAPASGVTCMIRRGCDKTRTGCNALSNILRYGGCPDAPSKTLMA